jgi:hypothetical protein
VSKQEVRKAEEALIAAVGKWRESSRPMDKTPWPGVIASHYDALVALRAPPKPMSAEERASNLARMWERNDITPGSITMQVNLENAIREAESAAWDRAVEACRAADVLPASGIFWDNQGRGEHGWKIGVGDARHAIENLLGKCHEARP